MVYGVIMITILCQDEALADSLWCVVYGVIMITILCQDEAVADSLWCVVCGVWCYYDHNSVSG